MYTGTPASMAVVASTAMPSATVLSMGTKMASAPCASRFWAAICTSPAFVTVLSTAVMPFSSRTGFMFSMVVTLLVSPRL